MMITPIDKLPSSPTDENKAKRDGMMCDVYTIIEQNIPFTKITADYSENYMRSAIQSAIRRATWRWNQNNTQKLDYSKAFEIHRRKDGL
jgi:hypothetical protein